MKTIFILLLVCFISPLTRAGEKHDLHLSLCELRFNEASSSFEVSIKIFIDDLELAMKKEGIGSLHIGATNESPLAEERIAEYLDKFFSIEIDGVKLKGDFIGKENTEDLQAVWCYLEYSKEKSPAKKCTFSNRILLDIYSDQRNIMDIRMNKSHKDYTILDASRSTWTYSY